MDMAIRRNRILARNFGDLKTIRIKCIWYFYQEYIRLYVLYYWTIYKTIIFYVVEMSRKEIYWYVNPIPCIRKDELWNNISLTIWKKILSCSFLLHSLCVVHTAIEEKYNICREWLFTTDINISMPFEKLLNNMKSLCA